MDKQNIRRYLNRLAAASLVLLIASCSQKSTTAEVEQINQQQNAATTTENTIGVTQSDQKQYQKAVSALSVRNYKKAKRLFAAFTRQYPEQAGAYVNLALIAFKLDDDSQARQMVTKALERNPNQAQAYNLSAQLHLKKGDIKKARTDYEKAVGLKPNYSNAHYNLALLYDIFLQEIALAIKHYSIYLSLLDKDDERTQDWVNHLKGTLNNG